MTGLISPKRENLEQDQRYASLFKGKPFSRKRFDLSNACSKNADEGNRFALPFVGFWVVSTNDENFQVEMYVNGDNNFGDSIPLSPQMNPEFSNGGVFAGCVLSWPAQPGKYIEIIFFHEFSVRLGTLKASQTNSTNLSDGSIFNNDNKSVTSTPSIILDASGTRKKGTIYNQSPLTLYVGSQATLVHADYQKKAKKIAPGNEFVWRNSAAIYVRTETTTTDEVCIFEET